MRYIYFCPGSDLPRVWAVPQDLHPEARERQVRKRYVAHPPQKKNNRRFFYSELFCVWRRFGVDNQTHFRISGRGGEILFWGDELAGKL